MSTYQQERLCCVLHLIVEAAGCVEIHFGIESARAYDAAVVTTMDKVHYVWHGVLSHPAAHKQLQARLACDLSVAVGVGTEIVGVHHTAILKL